MSRTRTTPPKLELDIDLSLDDGSLIDVSIDGMDPDFLESGHIPPAPSVPTFELDVELPSYDVDESSGVVSWQVEASAPATPPAPAAVRGDAVPRVAMSRDKIAQLPLDHRAGFILSLVDGSSTVDEILDVSGMLIRLAPKAVFCASTDM